jgi:hypothetical protein
VLGEMPSPNLTKFARHYYARPQETITKHYVFLSLSTMKLISDIINDLVAENTSAVVPLQKTKILATRLGNKDLLNWANLELSGYSNKEMLPSYRKATGTILGDFINGYNQVTNYPLPLPSFGDGLDEEMRTFYIMNDVATLERFGASGEESLMFRYPDGVKQSIESIMRNSNGPYFQLLHVGVSVPIHVASQAITAVKNKLLDFMLELEREFGMETELEDLKKQPTKINYIMETTIHNTGDGNVINTGEQAQITANIKIKKGDKSELQDTLATNGLTQDDINNLLEVVDAEEPTGKKFGQEVNLWIQKMMGKALDGSWQVGIGAAGTLLAEALHKYYGL